MALEAFGIASSAAGLISLGLTVCQSLVQYYSSWKDAMSDVARMLVSVEALERTYRLLQHTVQDNEFDASLVERVDEALISCQAGLETLRKKLEKIKIASEEGGFREKMSNKIQRTAYPFKESTLVKLREIVNELRGDLGLALSALQIDTSATAIQKLNLLTEGLAPITTGITELNLKAGETNARMDSLSCLSAQAAMTAQKIESRQNDDYLLGFYRWLSPLGDTFVRKQHATFGLDNRQDGTWKWLLATKEFKNWLAGYETTLWCPGQPGVGKTVLTSSIVDYLEREYHTEGSGIAYIYCDYNDDRQTAVNLLACILRQLAVNNHLMTDTLRRLYDEHISKGTRLSTSEYCSLLRKTIDSFSRVLIVIDALDECSQRERDRVRDAFLTEIKALQPKVQLLITSRDIPDLALEFQDAIRLQIRASEDAIADYIAARIDVSRNLQRHVRRSPKLRGEIIQKISRKADGMFLLVRMHVDSIATKSVIGDVKSMLSDLPAGLEELDSAYDRVVLRILNQDTDDAKMATKLLTWLFYTTRPLTLLEAQHAMSIRLGATNLHDDFLPDVEIIISVCAGIVTVEQESGNIAFVHYTTKEYFRRRLDSRGAKPFLLPQEHLAQDCLTYLLFDEFREGTYASKEVIDSRLRKYHFLDYAAKNWGNHAHEDLEPLEPRVKNLALSFLFEQPAMTFSVQIMTSGDGIWGFGRSSNTISALWLASHFGLVDLVRLLLDGGAEIEAIVSGQETALYRAAINGHTSVVRLLLDRGANVETQCEYRGTALCGAAWKGKEAVVKLLVERGASVEAKNLYGETALHRAAEDGQVSAVRLLLESGADVNAEYIDGRTALTWSAGKARTAVVRLLLDYGARVTAKDASGWTALHCVTISSRADIFSIEVIQLLVDHGLDLESRTKDGQTALNLAIRFRSKGIAKYLVERGAKVDSTALQAIAIEGDEEMMLLMLAKEASVHEMDGNSYLSATRLFRAIGSFSDALIQDYIAEIVSMNDSLSEMLLLGALKNKNEQLALLVVEKVSNYENKDMDGETALCLACKNGFSTLTKLLLERGADVDAKDGMGLAVPHMVALGGNQDLMRILLEAGVVVDEKDRFGRTALMSAARSGHEVMARLLLDKHANIHARDEDGKTALHHASGEGHDVVARLLLRNGAEIEAMDLSGRTALVDAATGGSKMVTQLLLEEGANPENVHMSRLKRDRYKEHVDFTAAVQIIQSAQNLRRRQRSDENETRGRL